MRDLQKIPPSSISDSGSGAGHQEHRSKTGCWTCVSAPHTAARQPRIQTGFPEAVATTFSGYVGGRQQYRVAFPVVQELGHAEIFTEKPARNPSIYTPGIL